MNGSFVDEFTSTGVNTRIGLDWDTSGNLYVSSYNGKFVQKFNTSGEDLGKFISSNLPGPTNIWFNTAGDLLVNDYNGGAVKRFDSRTCKGVLQPPMFKFSIIENVTKCLYHETHKTFRSPQEQHVRKIYLFSELNFLNR